MARVSECGSPMADKDCQPLVCPICHYCRAHCLEHYHLLGGIAAEMLPRRMAREEMAALVGRPSLNPWKPKEVVKQVPATHARQSARATLLLLAMVGELYRKGL